MKMVRVHDRRGNWRDVPVELVQRTGHIQQIIPASGYWAVFYDGYSSGDEAEYLLEPVAAWAVVCDYEASGPTAEEYTSVVAMVPAPDLAGLELARSDDYIGLVPAGDHDAARKLVASHKAREANA